MSPRELIVLVAMCLVWGFHFVVIKTAVGQLPPMFYAAIRMTVVAAIVSPLLRWRSGDMAGVLTAGLCFGAFNYAFIFSGMKLASASAVAVAIQLHTPFATILAMIFLRDRFGWRRAVGIALAFAGVAIIALGKPEEMGGEPTIGIGVGLVAAGAFCEAIGAILVKQAKTFKPMELLAWFALVGTLGLWAMTFIFEAEQGAAFAASDKSLIIGAIVYSAIGGSLFGHSAYYWLLQRLPVSVVASSVPLVTVFAVFFGVVLLGDPFGWRFIVGGLLTSGGVVFVLLRAAGKKGIKAPLNEAGLAP